MAQAINNFTLTGNLTAKPEIRTTESGKKYIFATLAVNAGKDNTNFLAFVAWEKVAENIAKYCDKGDCISIIGSIGSYKREENTVIRLTADSVSFIHKANHKSEPETKKSEPENDQFFPVNYDPFAGL